MAVVVELGAFKRKRKEDFGVFLLHVLLVQYCRSANIS